jgi:hypothetical protein
MHNKTFESMINTLALVQFCSRAVFWLVRFAPNSDRAEV